MTNDNTRRAIQLLQSGQPQDALEILKVEVSNNPTDQELNYNTAFAFRMVGDFDNAVKFYKRAIIINPNFYSAHYGLGIVYQLIKDYDSSISELRKAIEIEPNVVDAYNSLALTFKRNGEIERALNTYNIALEKLVENCSRKIEERGIKPTNLSPDKKVAIVNIEFMQQIPILLKQDFLYCTLQNGIGCCYAEIGKIDEARNAFLESIEFIPDGVKYDAPHYGLQQLDR